MNCPFCESEISDTAKKCRFCGEWIADPAPGSRPNTGGYQTGSVTARAVTKGIAEDRRREEKKRILRYVVMGIATVCGILTFGSTGDFGMGMVIFIGVAIAGAFAIPFLMDKE